MENKKSFGKKAEAFFAGKGFYIVLFLCIAVIGVSAWILLSSMGTQTDVDLNNDANNLASVDDNLAAPSDDGASLIAPPAIEDDGLTDQDASVTEDGDPVNNADEDNTAVWSQNDSTQLSSDLFIWPVNGDIVQRYSIDALLYDRTLADWRTHDGLDIAVALGTKVMASGSGMVESIYTDDLYGVTVIIDHGNGLKSIYSNLADTPTVYVGDGIIAGETIGSVGNTALRETGETYHLHYAMTLNGVSVDPGEYLP